MQRFTSSSQLVPSELMESQTIEFKGWTFPFTKEQLSDLHNLICSWRNTTGGSAIIGIREDDDGNFHIEGMYLDSFMKQRCSDQIAGLGVTPSLSEVRPTFIPITKSSELQKYLVKIDVSPGNPNKYYGRDDSNFNFIRSAARCPKTKKYKNIKIKFEDVKRKKQYTNISVPVNETEENKLEQDRIKHENSKEPEDYYIIWTATSSNSPSSKYKSNIFLTSEEAQRFANNYQGTWKTSEQYIDLFEQEDFKELLKRMRSVNEDLLLRQEEMMERLDNYHPYSRLGAYTHLEILRKLLDTMRKELKNEKVDIYDNDEPH